MRYYQQQNEKKGIHLEVLMQYVNVMIVVVRCVYQFILPLKVARYLDPLLNGYLFSFLIIIQYSNANPTILISQPPRTTPKKPPSGNFPPSQTLAAVKVTKTKVSDAPIRALVRPAAPATRKPSKPPMMAIAPISAEPRLSTREKRLFEALDIDRNS